MKNKFTLSAIVAALIIAGWGGYTLGSQSRNSHGVEPTKQASDDGRKVLYWYDPMVPGQRFDKPGKSPFMDMELVPRYANESGPESDNGVSISARQQQNLGIKTAVAERHTFTSNLKAYGTVAVNERTLSTLSAPSAGVIEQLKVRALQQSVKAGETLAVIWNPSWSSAQQEYLAIRAMGDNALTQAARQRLALQFMPESVIRAVERSGKVQPRMTIAAPRSGYVSKLEVREGQQVATTRNLKARIELSNPKQQLKPGMYLNVASVSSHERSALAVPQSALMTTGENTHLLLSDGNGHFTPVAVRTGESQGEWVEIKDGITDGQSVVTSGQFMLDSEASLRNALPQFSDDKPATDTASAEISQTAQYTTTGVIKAVDGENVTISHEAIPALKWGPMTMDFTLPGGKLPEGVQLGSHINFSFSMDENGIVIRHIMPAEMKMDMSGGQS
ncbi:efflux RND transporter periplasmic adaptor subunit [Hafnia paralvei]|uniref:efflux RND transporter periplasmic adaptor subunit n=1 Tax=Hafnia paralvei TaxID=546367 RepID=UPI00267218CB|nr:efflux RND transporter periplasmic adaptor subunit [Hafnia paralvei]